MADLNLQDLFGTGVTFNNTNREITFSLNDISSNVFDVSGIDDTNVNEYASKILWSILDYLCSFQPETNNDENRGIYVTNQGKRTAVRNNVAQFSFGLLVSAYTPDNLGVKLNPDDLVPQSNVF